MAEVAKQLSLVERMQRVVLFRNLSRVEKFKLKYALLLAFIPAVCSVVPLLLVFVFSKLNLYYLEGNGVIIEPQIRVAYYDQVISEILPIMGYFIGLLALTTPVAWIVMNWVTYPFIRAEKAIRKLLSSGERIDINSGWQAENIDFEETVTAYLKAISEPKSAEKNQEETVRYSLSYSFLFKFLAVFVPLGLIAAGVLRVLIDSAYGKIVSLALNLLHGRSVQSHYIIAQQEVLEDAQAIMLFISLLAFGLIGRSLSHHISTMIFVFTRAMREGKFPIRLRPTDIYHSLAEALNLINNRRG